MIRLDTTTRSLEAILGGAVSTNQLPVTVSYSDKTSSAYTGASKLTNTNSATAVTIATAPAASTVRDVDYVSVRNSDTAAATVTIRYNDNTTLYVIITATLAVGDQLIYTHGNGWATLDSSGNTKGISANSQPLDATLTSIALLGTAADKYAYTTAADTWAEGAITSVGRSFLAAATAAAQRILIVASGHAYISGLIASNNAGDANNDIDIAAGECIDSTNASILVGSALTKRLDAAWAAGTNQGGLDTGAKASSTEYYIHAILKDSDNSVDYLFSLSRTAPTMPAGYTKFRHIGWVKTDGGSNILGFVATELPGGGLNYQWKVPVVDVSLANTLTTAARTDALSVPTGIKVRPISVARTYDATDAHTELISDPDTTDTAPGASGPFTISSVTPGSYSLCNIRILTNTSRQIRTRSTLATVDEYIVTTFGFEWSRR